MLADVDSSSLDSLGLVNPEGTGMSKGVAFPGLIYVDNEGRILEAFFEESYRIRPTPGSVLTKLFPNTRSAPILASGQDFLLEQTADGGTLGSQWEISATFSLPEGSHLYAPDNESYVPLSLELDPHSSFTFESPVLPTPQTEYLPSIDETLSVYSGIVRVSVPVTIAPNESLKTMKEPEATTIKGVLKYQICTDTTCLLPVETEVEWKAVVKPVDRERASEGARH